jgi:hypothetical protein
MKISLAIVSVVLMGSLFGLGCRSSDQTSSLLVEDGPRANVVGLTFCQNLSPGSAQQQDCLRFEDGQSGTASFGTGAGSNQGFRYSIAGSVVSIFIMDGRGPEIQKDYTLSADGGSLTDSRTRAIWQKHDGGKLIGHTFCSMNDRKVGSPRDCLKFEDGQSGLASSSADAGSNQGFRYSIAGSVVSIFIMDGRGPEIQKDYTLSADGGTLTDSKTSAIWQKLDGGKLVGQNFCRKLSTRRGQQQECFRFEDGQSGLVSSGVATGWSQGFRYSIAGSVVSIFIMDGRGPEIRKDYKLSEDGGTLTNGGLTWTKSSP